MAVTYAVLTGRITHPGSDTALPGLVTAVPLTKFAGVVIPGERLTQGVVSAPVDAAGNLPAAGLKVPVVAGSPMLWRLVFEPSSTIARPDTSGAALPPWPFYVGAITASTTVMALATTEPTALLADFPPSLVSQVLTARDQTVAVGNTNDTIIASRVTDPASATRGALSATIGRVYTPEQFGAVGDYDPATNVGTDDTVAIQAAADAAVANGRQLQFLDKHYRISDTITFTNPSALTITGHKSGLAGGLGNARGSWLHYTGVTQKAMVKIANGQNILWSGLGLHGRSVADGILITSNNAPVATQQSYRDFYIYRAVQGVYLNDGGAGTQSDQMIFDSLRMEEIVTTAFRTNSTNATGIKFLRCSTFMASSGNDVVQYLFERGALLSLDTCIGGGGQDFVRTLGPNVTALTIDNSQSEGSTHASPAFLRLGAVGEAGVVDTTIIRNCIPDGPVIVNAPSRRLLTIGNKWNDPASVVRLLGSDVRWLSLCENLPSSVSVTGANAQLRRIGADVNGRPTSGQHIEGEMLWDTLPATNGALGWVCVASGSPGNWLPVGALGTGGVAPTGASGTGTTGIEFAGNQYVGQVTFITAAGLVADSEALAVVVDSGANLSTATTRIMLTPANSAGAAAGVYVGTVFPGQFGINLRTPPADLTTMKFNYQILR